MPKLREYFNRVKKTPPRYISGVRTNVGIIEMSSKLSANTAFKNPIKENRIEVKRRTVMVKSGLTTVNSG